MNIMLTSILCSISAHNDLNVEYQASDIKCLSKSETFLLVLCFCFSLNPFLKTKQPYEKIEIINV